MKHARTLVPLAALAVLSAGALAPATAAVKPKLAGSYKVTLQPDPTINAYSLAEMKNCHSTRPEATDKRNLTVPTAGKFKAILDSPADPTGRVADWDMYITDDKGTLLGKGSTEFSHEEVSITFKRKTVITVYVCNLTGSNDGTVTYTLK